MRDNIINRDNKYRKYVFLTYSISNIGGSQIYVRNKTNFLESKGWLVEVFSYQTGDLIIKELSKYRNNIIKELEYGAFHYTKKDRNKLIKTIIRKSNLSNHELIIESNSIGLSTWGELLAKELNCKHFIYLVSETFNINHQTFNYLEFKHERRELAGIHEKAINNLFKPYKLLNSEECYNLRAYCSNVVEDIENLHISNIKNADFSIGSIGRLDKPYLIPILNQLKDFIEKHHFYRFNIILIGGTNDNLKYIQIKNLFSNTNNVNIYITGFIYPIPTSLIKKSDVYISVAASALASRNLGIPTITVDSINYTPLGILGYNTDNNMFADDLNNNKYDLNLLLEKVLIKKECVKVDIVPKLKMPEYYHHMNFLKDSNPSLIYYNIDLLLNRTALIKKVMMKCFGISLYKKLANLKLRVNSLNRKKL